METFESDSFVIDFVQHALKAAIQGDRDGYDQMVMMMDPSANVITNDPASRKEQEDKDAMLVATLGSLSEVASLIDVTHHQSLYTSILGMSLWKCNPIVADSLVDLVVCLASSSGSYLDACLDMLVCHFIAPPIHFGGRWLFIKRSVADRVFTALQDIFTLVPLSPTRLLPVILRRMPSKYAPHNVIVLYTECMLRLEGTEIGKYIGSSLLKSIIDRLVDLDVDIKCEDVAKTDSNKNIFDIELDSMNGTLDPWENIKDSGKTKNIFKGNKVAETLDSLMTITYQHLEQSFNDGRFAKVFETLMDSFQKSVLTAYKSKFVQFLMFFACSLDPDAYSVEFSRRLLYIFLSEKEPPLRRMSAVSYLGSYLSRAKFVSPDLVAIALKSLVNWCLQYCKILDGNMQALTSRNHEIFYSACQAVMYILCFQMRSVIEDLNDMPLELVLFHTLDPLKVCLPSIVKEFLRQANAVGLFTTDNVVGPDLSRGVVSLERLDTFFPFDPYLLKESERFIQPHFQFWSMVKPPYDDACNDEDESENEDFDDVRKVTSMASNSTISSGQDIPKRGSDDEIDCSMEAMSITPKDTFIHQAVQMPARIRPSTGPI